MTHRTDDKKTALLTLTGETDGHIDDLEITWLQSVGATSDRPNKAWLEVFALAGATSNNFNNAAAEFLTGLGYTGSLPDMWAAYWAAGGGTGGGGSWEYADLATAEASGDPWQDGDDVQITGGALFLYQSALAVNSYSGLIHKYPYDGVGTLGALDSVVNQANTPQNVDPDTWSGWTLTGTGTKGVNHDFDVSGGRSRFIAITTSRLAQATAPNVSSTPDEGFAIVDGLTTARTGADSADTNYATFELIVPVDGSNTKRITLLWKWVVSLTNWIVTASSNVTTTQPVANETRVWMYLKDGRWAVWFGVESTPNVSGATPRSVVNNPNRRLVHAAISGLITTNVHTKHIQTVTGSMVTS